MKYLLLAIIFSLQVLSVSAQPLSKELIEAVFLASEKLDSLEGKYPEVFSKMDEFSSSEQDKSMKYLESSPAYPEIKAILKSGNISSLKEMEAIFKRIMGGLSSAQEGQVSAEQGLSQMVLLLEESIENMKRQGVSADVIKSMEVNLEESKAQRAEILGAIKAASEEDKKFVRDNLDWVMSKMPDSEEDFDNDNGNQEYFEEGNEY